ncbi:MAG: phage major capsid protein [Clostridia bacterium]|nr:phage major capsid protein [Clostridia bacterium]
MNEKELIEKQNDLMTRADELFNKAKEEKRELTPDEMQELAEIRDDIRRIKEALGLDRDFKELKQNACGTKKRSAEDEAKEENEIKAFENYIRGFVVHERAGELTKANNGAVIPTTIVNRIIKKVYDISPILEKSSKYNVKGNLDIPFYPADGSTTINVAYQTEFVAMTSSTGNFSSINLTGFLAGALTKISRSLINNAQFDIVGFVVDEMAYQISRFIEGELLNGTEDKVEGLSGLTNTIESADTTGFTGDDLIDVQARVKDVYQKNAIWIMSTATRTALRKLKDDIGQYLLIADLTSEFGYKLLGKDVYVSDNMANGKIYYGDMSGLATKMSEDINIEVLREKYADEHAYGVIGWFEFDSKVENEQKIASLTLKTE